MAVRIIAGTVMGLMIYFALDDWLHAHIAVTLVVTLIGEVAVIALVNQQFELHREGRSSE